MYTMKNMFSEL